MVWSPTWLNDDGTIPRVSGKSYHRLKNEFSDRKPMHVCHGHEQVFAGSVGLFYFGGMALQRYRELQAIQNKI